MLLFLSWATNTFAINIKKGEVAPFDGVLFEEERALKILADLQYFKSEIDLQKEKNALYLSRIADLEKSFDIQQKQYSDIVAGKDEQIKLLQDKCQLISEERDHIQQAYQETEKELKRNIRWTHWKIVGTFVIGVLVGFGLGSL